MVPQFKNNIILHCHAVGHIGSQLEIIIIIIILPCCAVGHMRPHLENNNIIVIILPCHAVGHTKNNIILPFHDVGCIG